jgi:hypothetical protein
VAAPRNPTGTCTRPDMNPETAWMGWEQEMGNSRGTVHEFYNLGLWWRSLCPLPGYRKYLAGYCHSLAECVWREIGEGPEQLSLFTDTDCEMA